jgi:ABC-2 type transport system ATP-binding protein
MKKAPAIQAKGISKTFHISEDSHNTGSKKVEAIKPMDFEIYKGECIGILGRNGCGKSTLIRLLAGVFPCDTGEINIFGTTLLMNLGVGMSHQLTARENIYVSASVLGLKIKEIDAIFDTIVDFAELRDFIDTKIKYFSSGMVARLGFSIAVNAGADIMFLDEIFAVGDMKFQEKAIKVFESSWIEGKTVILVSHSMDVVQKYCSRTAFMKNGSLMYFGDTEKAVQMYIEDNH